MSNLTLNDKKRAFLFNLVLALVMLVPLLLSVIFSNSIIALTDFFQESSDTIAIFFSYMAIRKISQGENHVYNYGYGKLEAVSSLIVAGVMVISLIIVIFNLVIAFKHPVVLTGFGVYIAIVTNIIDGSISFYQWKKMRSFLKDTVSPILEGQIKLFQAGFIASALIAVSLTLGLMFQGSHWGTLIDPLGGMVLALILTHSIFNVFSSSMDNLMDKTLEEGLQIAILRALVNHFDRYEYFYEVKSRRSGSDIYVELFIEFPADAKIAECLNSAALLHQSVREEIGGGYITIVPTNSEMMRLQKTTNPTDMSTPIPQTAIAP